MAKRGEKQPWRVDYEWPSGIRGCRTFTTEDRARQFEATLLHNAQVRESSIQIDVTVRKDGKLNPAGPRLSAVPGHYNEAGQFCSSEGLMTPSGRCPAGCDHADHYSNDGHPECEDSGVTTCTR